MYINKKLPYLFLYITLSLITSCNTEPIDFEPFDDDASDDNDIEMMAEGDYWPLAVNNQWTYDNEIDGQAQMESIVEINDTEIINGTEYFVFNNFFAIDAITNNNMVENFNVSTFIRQENDIYLVRLSEQTFDIPNIFRVTQQGYNYTILRENDAVGTSLTEVFDTEISFESLNPVIPDPPGVTANYTSEVEVLERDMTLTVNGETFSDVIKTRQILTVEFSDPMFPNTEVTTDYYYALNVGPVRVESTTMNIIENTIGSIQILELNAFSLN